MVYTGITSTVATVKTCVGEKAETTAAAPLRYERLPKKEQLIRVIGSISSSFNIVN
jgi:hypothetical protein